MAFPFILDTPPWSGLGVQSTAKVVSVRAPLFSKRLYKAAPFIRPTVKKRHIACRAETAWGGFQSFLSTLPQAARRLTARSTCGPICGRRLAGHTGHVRTSGVQNNQVAKRRAVKVFSAGRPLTELQTTFT